MLLAFEDTVTMPRYSPIEIPVPLAASGSDLVAFRWDTGGVVADFLLPDDDERAIRMTFNKPCIIRILDEMPLSTENDSRSEGLVPDHFAYRVEGSAFVDAQSEAWMLVNAQLPTIGSLQDGPAWMSCHLGSLHSRSSSARRRGLLGRDACDRAPITCGLP